MLEVDPSVLANSDDDYASSGYDTSTESLASSVQQYIYENGRRYHSYYGTEKYLMPTDETEQDRLDLYHEIYLVAWNDNLHEAPLTTPHRILDIGTGTGIWAIDMADKYPMAEVIGTDLSPIQPSWIPANCRFEVDDAMKEWTFRENFFDFIHARNLNTGVTDWAHLTSEMMRCTAPGGYVELLENSLTLHCDDGTMKPDHGADIFLRRLREALEKMGRPHPTHEFLKNQLENAGFEDVQMLTAKEPFGPWPKDPRMKRVGAMSLLNGSTGFESYGMAAFTRVLGMDAAEARGICERALQDARNKNYHVYCLYFRVYGRKPAVENRCK
ncbi:S-adenosyl-L-methionine-dependent methyltransferase [Pyronema domesticum]|uniref:Similar to Demethylmenaquinone methyltransferase acc. no. Q9RRT0 n=1 Tax=Pyronema omphalodes (strain CBS 100304) TaxID=1076935 RepID=U4L0H6_PYROM|nr:S-adenosyl-L-methionine-dependent methyltransferase [Pyronema domesticum]CCX05524.1 Similar to Demethylmenaquinone methyltransferase; acc. no. Q9RRT0 [Pyronema omphalodes CBS 100304]